MAKHKQKAELSMPVRLGIAISLSILGGAFLFLAYPPVNFWPLAWVAAIPYVVAMHRFMPRKWAAVAPTISYTIWLWPFLARIFGIPGAPFAFKHMGLLFALVTFITSNDRKFHELTGYKWFIIQGVLGWVGFEMTRAFIPVLGTMGFIANTLASQSWLIQPVSVFSIYGLNFLIILVNYTLAQLTLNWVDSKWTFTDAIPVEKESTKRWAFITSAVLVFWIILSLVLFNLPLNTPPVRVAAIHMYLDGPGHQASDEEQIARLDQVTDLAMQAGQQGAEVIYLPEMLFGFDPQQEYSEELRAVAEKTGAYLFIPYAFRQNDDWHNETIILSPDGEFSTMYGKLHPVGEPRTVTAGAFPVKNTPLGTLGSIICMDGVFTDAARKVSKNGAQILAIPSYDTTVGISEQNWTHFTMRAVENRVPVINADRGYYSMITDAHGTIVEDVRSPEGASAVLIADIQPGKGISPYHIGADWFGWLCLAGFIAFTIYQMMIENRAKKKKT